VWDPGIGTTVSCALPTAFSEAISLELLSGPLHQASGIAIASSRTDVLGVSESIKSLPLAADLHGGRVVTSLNPIVSGATLTRSFKSIHNIKTPTLESNYNCCRVAESLILTSIESVSSTAIKATSKVVSGSNFYRVNIVESLIPTVRLRADTLIHTVDSVPKPSTTDSNGHHAVESKASKSSIVNCNRCRRIKSLYPSLLNPNPNPTAERLECSVDCNSNGCRLNKSCVGPNTSFKQYKWCLRWDFLRKRKRNS